MPGDHVGAELGEEAASLLLAGRSRGFRLADTLTDRLLDRRARIRGIGPILKKSPLAHLRIEEPNAERVSDT